MLTKALKTILLILVVFFLSYCSKTSDTIETDVLVRIGDKTISINEFIQRAEYTIRPNYCKGNTNVHKKIVLNSLIAEKLLASELGDENQLSQNKHFQNYISGRREQAMRQSLFHKEMYNKVKLDTLEIKKVFNLAGRKYRIQYFSFKDSSTARKIETMLYQQGSSFEDVYHELSGTDSIPEREIEYNMFDENTIHEMLYSDTIQVNQVFGPFLKEKDLYMVIKIKDWTNRVLISNKEIQQRWTDVKERLTDKYAEKIWLEYAARIMKGKRLVFSKEIFNDMTRLFAPFYLGRHDETKNLFLNRVFDNEIDDSTQLQLQDLGKGIVENRDKTFFQIDGQDWTVKDFENEIEIHPLIFRKRKISPAEFPEQFKLAIVDMIRDKYITQDAYNKGYQNEIVVKRAENMWSDALKSVYQEGQFLKANIDSTKMNTIDVISTYLNPYVDELQTKYNDKIEIDVDKFNKIQLTQVDMFVTQRNAAFPIVVPGFPQLTTDPWINYGRKMD